MITIRKSLSCYRGLAFLGLVAVLVILSQLLLVQGVLAHANLVRAEPSPDSVLEVSPRQVTIWFAETIESSFSEIQVLNNLGKRMDNGDSTVDPNDHTVLTVTLPELPKGIYTVVWRNMSAADGHTVGGSYVFSVGVPLLAAAPIVSHPVLQSPFNPVVRWLMILGILTVVGGLSFNLLVIKPGLSSDALLKRLAHRLDTRMWRLIWTGVAIFLVSSTGLLIVQSHTISSPLASVLTATAWGKMWLWRMGMALVMVVALGLASGRGRQQSTHHGEDKLNNSLRLASLLASMGVLLTISLTSHAAATVQAQIASVFSDYIHLIAAGFWVGGVFHLVFIIPILLSSLSKEQQKQVLPPLVSRFSHMATLCVGILIITGLYMSWVQVTILSAIATPYGLTLVVKVSLIVLILILAALNLLWVRPRLPSQERGAHWLKRLVVGEAVLAVLVLLSVGFMTSMEPGRQAASRQIVTQKTTHYFHHTVDNLHISLQITPGWVGRSRAELFLDDNSGAPARVSQVSLIFKYLNQDLGEEPVTVSPAGQGRYIVDNVLLSLAGKWQADLLVTRPDAFDTRDAFQFEVTPTPVSGIETIALPAKTGKLLWGVEMLLIGFLFGGTGLLFYGGRRTRAGLTTMVCGSIAILAGLFLVLGL